MQPEEIKDLLGCFERWVLNPLKEDVQNKTRSHFNIFIVLSVAIDNLANIRYSGEIRPRWFRRNVVGKRYRKYIQHYMPKYKKHRQLMYDGFRNKLVHAFQSAGIDIRDDDSSVAKHLDKVENGNVCLHSKVLLQDVVESFELLKQQLIGPNPDQKVLELVMKSDYKTWTRTPTGAA